MTFFKYSLFLAILCAFLSACRDNQKEQELVIREQQLLDKEKQFAMKEADYQSLVKMRDSLLAVVDTSGTIQSWPAEIAGLWNGKSVCRESNCNEYVIGDQRSNFWEFVSDSTGLYTRILNNNQVVRVYHAQFDSTHIQLYFQSDSSSAKNLDLRVELDRGNPSLIKGMQTIGIDKSCSAKFSIELTRKPIDYAAVKYSHREPAY
jgi:hypothetical protein